MQAVLTLPDACRLCIHREGASCSFGGAQTPLAHARSYAGDCGPDARHLWIASWGAATGKFPAAPGTFDACPKCQRPLFGVGCCHCPR